MSASPNCAGSPRAPRTPAHDSASAITSAIKVFSPASLSSRVLKGLTFPRASTSITRPRAEKKQPPPKRIRLKAAGMTAGAVVLDDGERPDAQPVPRLAFVSRALAFRDDQTQVAERLVALAEDAPAAREAEQKLPAAVYTEFAQEWFLPLVNFLVIFERAGEQGPGVGVRRVPPRLREADQSGRAPDLHAHVVRLEPDRVVHLFQAAAPQAVAESGVAFGVGARG